MTTPIALPAHLARALALSSLLMLCACGDDGPSTTSDTATSQADSSPPTGTSSDAGDLTVRYSFAPGVSCDQNQEMVQDIRVDVGEGGVAGTQTVACDNAGGEVVLAGITPGAYPLFVYGVDDVGDRALDNLGGSTNDEEVTVLDGQDSAVDVQLAIAPARVEVRLQVTVDGFAAQCTSDEIMIRGLRVDAWDGLNAELLRSHDFDLCDFDGYEEVPDMDRAINGRRLDTIVLHPLDAGGSEVGAQVEVVLPGVAGAGKLVQIDVSCEGDMCNAQLLGG